MLLTLTPEEWVIPQRDVVCATAFVQERNLVTAVQSHPLPQSPSPNAPTPGSLVACVSQTDTGGVRAKASRRVFYDQWTKTTG